MAESQQFDQEQLNIPSVADRVSSMDAFMQVKRPILYAVMDPGKPIGQHVQEFHKPRSHEALQPADDFISAMTERTNRLLGSEAAAKMQQRLTEHLVVYSPNHMAIDYWPLTFQSVILAGMGEKPGGIIPVLAGEGVHADNDAWALGPQLARQQIPTFGNAKTEGRTVPVRFSVIPRRNRSQGLELDHAIAKQLPPFTAEQVHATLGETILKGLQANKTISWKEMVALGKIRDTVYLDPHVLQQTTYSDQATIANHRLWQLVHAEELHPTLPDLAVHGFETISIELLTRNNGDLLNKNSLVHRVLFDEDLRGKVLEALNDVPGCWHLDMENRPPDSGTMFFWGIDVRDNGLVGMHLTPTDSGPVLRGTKRRDGTGRVQDIPFTPEGLDQALQDGRILPGLATSFMAIAFARGVVCYGGPMQVDYLTRMRNGLTASLQTTGHESWARTVAQIPTENFIAGPTPIIIRYLHDLSKARTHGPDDHIRPAGPVELATQPLTVTDYTKLRDISLGQAIAVNWPDLYRMVTTGDMQRDPHLETLTTREIADHFGGNGLVVVQGAHLETGTTGQLKTAAERQARRQVAS